MVLLLGKYGVVGRAIENKLVHLNAINPRDYSSDPNRRVDDRPYGGGPGMVMQYEPLKAAIEKATKNVSDSYVLCLSPQGKPVTQSDIGRFGNYQHLVLLAGRYEGIDERLIESHVDEEISIGDIVVSGGELPAMSMVDALVRQIPGALGHAESALQDSFVDGLLDCPHYTRPETIEGQAVPKILLGGDHQAVERWRKKQSLGRTFLRRPDLFSQLQLSKTEQELLDEYLKEQLD